MLMSTLIVSHRTTSRHVNITPCQHRTNPDAVECLWHQGLQYAFLKCIKPGTSSRVASNQSQWLGNLTNNPPFEMYYDHSNNLLPKQKILWDLTAWLYVFLDQLPLDHMI
eukprot:531263_1